MTTLHDYAHAFSTWAPSRKTALDLSKLLAEAVSEILQPQLPQLAFHIGGRGDLDVLGHTYSGGFALGVDVVGLNTRESLLKNWRNRARDFHAIAARARTEHPALALGFVLAIPGQSLGQDTRVALYSAMTGLRTETGADTVCVIEISKESGEVLDLPEELAHLDIRGFGPAMAYAVQKRQGWRTR